MCFRKKFFLVIKDVGKVRCMYAFKDSNFSRIRTNKNIIIVFVISTKQ